MHPVKMLIYNKNLVNLIIALIPRWRLNNLLRSAVVRRSTRHLRASQFRNGASIIRLALTSSNFKFELSSTVIFRHWKCTPTKDYPIYKLDRLALYGRKDAL